MLYGIRKIELETRSRRGPRLPEQEMKRVYYPSCFADKFFEISRNWL